MDKQQSLSWTVMVKIFILSCLQRLGILIMSTSQLLSLLLTKNPAIGSSPPNYADKSVKWKKPLPKLTKLFLPQKLTPHILKKKWLRKLLKWQFKGYKNLLPEKPVQKLELFKCDQCGHMASCKENLTKHIDEKHKKTETNDPEPILSNLSFHCDQCNFTGASDKGLKQHTRIKHRISQVDGNDSDSNGCSELI